jgi:Leucine-rich repeat (LRR) protein
VLPSEVSLLSKLTLLDVGINDLSSPLPPLENLINLTEVDIKSNYFDGIMPRFEKLTHLQTLDFSNNEFEGTLFDADNLTELKTFKISGNRISSWVLKRFTYSRINSLAVWTFFVQIFQRISILIALMHRMHVC